MTARSSRPADPLDAVVEFRVDPDAPAGNVIPALARLLIDLARRQNETSGPAMAARSSALVSPQPCKPGGTA
jgi:hypothetical protein